MTYVFKNWKKICEEKDEEIRRLKEEKRMPESVQEIINLIDMRIKINTELLEKGIQDKQAKIEELEYLKETILLAYEQGVTNDTNKS